MTQETFTMKEFDDLTFPLGDGARKIFLKQAERTKQKYRKIYENF